MSDVKIEYYNGVPSPTPLLHRSMPWRQFPWTKCPKCDADLKAMHSLGLTFRDPHWRPDRPRFMRSVGGCLDELGFHCTDWPDSTFRWMGEIGYLYCMKCSHPIGTGDFVSPIVDPPSEQWKDVLSAFGVKGEKEIDGETERGGEDRSPAPHGENRMSSWSGWSKIGGVIAATVIGLMIVFLVIAIIGLFAAVARTAKPGYKSENQQVIEQLTRIADAMERKESKP